MKLRKALEVQHAPSLRIRRSGTIPPIVDESASSVPVTTGPLLPELPLPEVSVPEVSLASTFDSGPVTAGIGSRLITTNLRGCGPAYTVLQECLARQESATARGRLARALGRSPLHPAARSLYSGALGEIVVANALSQLGDAWTVLNAVRVGPGDSMIDHVILGPGGIFTIDIRNHSGQKIWIGGSTFLTNGFKQGYMRYAGREAEEVSRLLSGVIGRPVTVTPLIVVVNPASITTGRKRPRITVVSSNTLMGWLMKRPRVISDRGVAHLSMFAEERRTWHAEPVTMADTTEQLALTEQLARFELLRFEVDITRQRTRQWLMALGGVATLTTPLAIIEIVHLVASFLGVPAT